MAKLAATDQERTPDNDATILRRVRTFGTLTMVGGAALTVGATLVDLGAFADLPVLASLGNALSAGAGLGLLFLPLGLRASRVGGRGALANAGAACLAISICLVSFVDVPAILDPTHLEAGGALGPVGLVLLSVGFLAWFVAIRRAGVVGGWRRYVFLVTGLWFFLTFPTIQLPLLVIPNGTPSFVPLAGVFGILQFLMGVVVREQVRRPIAVGGEPYGTRSLNSALHSSSRASVMASSRDIAWPTAHAVANASPPSAARAVFAA